MLPLGSIWQAEIWYLLPLMVVTSLVYGATRHEYPREILVHAGRSMLWLAVFLSVIFVIVAWMSYGL